MTNAQRNSFSLSKTSFSPKRAYRSRGTVGESPKRASTETRRRVKWTVETEKETSRCFAAPLSSGSDQEGRVKGVQFGRRMGRSLEIQARCFRVSDCLRRSKNIGHNHHGRMERYMRGEQDVRRLRGNH